ncbi:MAG: class A beta-lactamase-related serine hydrolase [Firmicutes bacterium]|nr:class A beta-lactamase-related serine hydrolase [Bacillota bacterium]
MKKLIFVFILTCFLITGVMLIIYKPWRGGILIEDPPQVTDTVHTDAKTPPKVQPVGKTEKKISDMKKEVESILADFPGKASLAFYDYETGEALNMDSGESFESASLVKIPIMYEVFRQIQEGLISQDKELVLEDSMKTGGAGVLKDEPAGSKWKISEILTFMITKSDNTAADMMIDLAGMENVEKTAVSLGAKGITLRRKIYDFAQIDKGKDNYATPDDMMVMLRAIVENKGVNEKYCQEMIDIMKKQTMRDRIPKLLPKDVVCASKTGGLTGFVHDCAIIYPQGKKPYVLVLMGKNVTDENKAKEIYAKTSLAVYKWIVK